MKRLQTFHETLIPMLVAACGCERYLELGTHENETIGKVVCPMRIGVDTHPTPLVGAKVFAMTTQAFLKGLASKYAPFDFVFIDADHRAESVIEDFNGVWPFVSPEGIVVAHDVNPETTEDTYPGFCGDAWRAAKTILESGKEGVILPYHPGLLIVRKRFRWGPERGTNSTFGN